MFAVRGDVAVGLAQFGMDRAGGPDDEALRQIEQPIEPSSWLGQALGQGVPLRAAVGSDGDRQLAARLGEVLPSEVYLAPIASGGRVAAFLYADNLPESRPLADTRALEIALCLAGLALDRALLRRTLAEPEDASGGSGAGT
jgi:hypothetical protein